MTTPKIEQATTPNRPENKGNYHLIPKAYKKVAGDLEGQFAELMLEQMDKTIDRSDELSTANNYYSSLQRSEHAKAMSSSDKGTGIKQMILDQIYPSRLRTEQNLAAYENFNNSRNKNLKANHPYAQGGQNE